MEMAWKDPDAIHLEVGQPDFPTPPHIVSAACEAAQAGFTRYTPAAGIPSLKKAIVTSLRAVHGIQVDETRVTVAPGAIAGLVSAIVALVDPGEEVLVPDPGWPNYTSISLLNGVTPKRYPLRGKNQFLPDIKELESCVTRKTKAIIVNTPSNPTGVVYPRKVMEELVSFARKHDLYIVADEVYDRITFNLSHTSFQNVDSEGRSVSVFSLSKTYSMTGWRIGYVVGSAEIIQMMTKILESTLSCSSSVSQKAAEAALVGSQDSVGEMVAAYRHRRDRVLALLKQRRLYGYTPEGAFYILIDISSTGMKSYDFVKRLLQEKKVAAAPGETFGPLSGDYVRICFAPAEEELMTGTERICDFIQERSTCTNGDAG